MSLQGITWHLLWHTASPVLALSPDVCCGTVLWHTVLWHGLPPCCGTVSRPCHNRKYVSSHVGLAESRYQLGNDDRPEQFSQLVPEPATGRNAPRAPPSACEAPD